MWSRALTRYTSFATRRPGWLIALALISAGLSLFYASQRLQMDARLEALLPRGTPEHRAREEARRRVINRAPLVLLVSSSRPALNRRLARRIARGVSAWPDARWVTQQRDLKFLLDRRLLYLPSAALRSLADRFEARLQWEQCRQNPLCANLDERPSLPTRAELRRHYRPFEELAGGAGVDLAKAPAKLERLGELCAPDGKICLVKVLMKGEPSDLGYATKVIARARRLLAATRPPGAPADLMLRVVGSYVYLTSAKTSAVKSLEETAAVSVVLLLLFVLLQFRGWRAFALLLGPLAVGASWALGLAAYLDPELNLMAAFTLTVLGGMGIDYGIHLTTRYGALRHEGVGVVEAARETLRELGVTLPIAAITTGVGFLALMAGSFRGFVQMGWVAALGIAAVVVAYLAIVPALLALFERTWPERRPLTRPLPWIARQPSRPWVIALVVAGLLCAVGGATLGLGLEMEYDYRRLTASVGDAGLDWNAGDRVMHGNAIVMMADREQALEAAATDLRRRRLERGSTLGLAISLGLFIPPEQPRRLKQIARLRRVVARASGKVAPELQRKLDRYKGLLAHDQPITRAALPPWIRQLIGERSGALGKIGLVYERTPGRDARAMERLRERLARWSERYPGVRFFAISAILGEVTAGLRADGPVVMLWTLGGILLATLLLGRSLLRVTTVLASLLLAGAITAGLMVLLGWRIHLYNLAAVPLIFGIGVDSAIYVVWAFGDRSARWSELVTTSRAVLGCALTTMAGFGGLMIASTPGLRAFGQLAALGIGVSVLVNLVWLPALLLVLRGYRQP